MAAGVGVGFGFELGEDPLGQPSAGGVGFVAGLSGWLGRFGVWGGGVVGGADAVEAPLGAAEGGESEQVADGGEGDGLAVGVEVVAVEVDAVACEFGEVCRGGGLLAS